MNKYLLGISILCTSLFLSSVAKAGDDYYTHRPSIDISTKLSKRRKLVEFNYMQPFFSQENFLYILDLKLKTDSYKNKEINLGLAYRYNLYDNAVIGSYLYLDHRLTANNFSVSGLTFGVECLSKYVDARANIYLPQNKRKKISHNGEQVVEIRGNSIYAISGGHAYESSLRGYDIEIGAPLFAFSESLNEQFGTKIYAAKYNFTGKNIEPVVGARFRIYQQLAKTYVGANSYNLYMNAETQYDRVRKRQNFVGVGLKISFGDAQNKNKKKGALTHRMMDPIVRDVDIVTNITQLPQDISDLYIGNSKINRVLYVGASDSHNGTGTKDDPYSFTQLDSMKHDDAVIIVTEIAAEKGGRELNMSEYHKIRSSANVLNGKKTKLTTSSRKDLPAISVTIHADTSDDIEITSDDDSVTHIAIDGVRVESTGPYGTKAKMKARILSVPGCKDQKIYPDNDPSTLFTYPRGSKGAKRSREAKNTSDPNKKAKTHSSFGNNGSTGPSLSVKEAYLNSINCTDLDEMALALNRYASETFSGLQNIESKAPFCSALKIALKASSANLEKRGKKGFILRFAKFQGTPAEKAQIIDDIEIFVPAGYKARYQAWKAEFKANPNILGS